MEELFDITLARWLNLFLSAGLVVYAHLVARTMKSFYIGVPLIVWAFQNLIFYSLFLLWHYDVILMPLPTAERLFSYWGTFSTLLGLITFFLYLYYIKRSCWRGNGI
jgi:hypothetical protein